MKSTIYIELTFLVALLTTKLLVAIPIEHGAQYLRSTDSSQVERSNSGKRDLDFKYFPDLD
eukprot:8624602-Ditylum_brightwellii.AAC.1